MLSSNGGKVHRSRSNIIIILLHLCNLLEHVLKHCISRLITKFTKCLMNTLWIMEVDDLNVFVGFIKSFGLVLEDDAFSIREINCILSILLLLDFHGLKIRLILPLEHPVIVQQTLLSSNLSTRVSVFHKLFDKPLHYWKTLGVIETLNLNGR